MHKTACRCMRPDSAATTHTLLQAGPPCIYLFVGLQDPRRLGTPQGCSLPLRSPQQSWPGFCECKPCTLDVLAVTLDVLAASACVGQCSLECAAVVVGQCSGCLCWGCSLECAAVVVGQCSGCLCWACSLECAAVVVGQCSGCPGHAGYAAWALVFSAHPFPFTNPHARPHLPNTLSHVLHSLPRASNQKRAPCAVHIDTCTPSHSSLHSWTTWGLTSQCLEALLGLQHMPVPCHWPAGPKAPAQGQRGLIAPVEGLRSRCILASPAWGLPTPRLVSLLATQTGKLAVYGRCLPASSVLGPVFPALSPGPGGQY